MNPLLLLPLSFFAGIFSLEQSQDFFDVTLQYDVFEIRPI